MIKIAASVLLLAAVGALATAEAFAITTNTTYGTGALASLTTGNDDAAFGYDALYYNTSGSRNTAVGVASMVLNTSGETNVAVGYETLYYNTTGSSNSAVGSSALISNATGSNNTALGSQALYSNTSGKGNAAQGVNALYSNTTGIRNLGIGSDALYGNNGSYNIALGYEAGYNVSTGSNNIEIGTSGTASDDGTIQIGSQGTQTSTTIAGIFGTTLTGSAVYVTSTGQLGVLASSERYKTHVAAMGSRTEKLERLRPVTFNLRSDRAGTVQYGLIAEEVAKIYPELVIRNAAGGIEGVRYEELAPMLLNEVQKQQAAIRALTEKQAGYAAEISDLRKLIMETQAGLTAHRAEGELIARQ
jgi:endosialidase-like protein